MIPVALGEGAGVGVEVEAVVDSFSFPLGDAAVAMAVERIERERERRLVDFLRLAPAPLLADYYYRLVIMNRVQRSLGRLSLSLRVRSLTTHQPTTPSTTTAAAAALTSELPPNITP